MPRKTIAALQEEIEELNDRISELESENEELRERLTNKTEINYVRSVEPPRAISKPISFGDLLWGLVAPLSWYDENSPFQGDDDAGENVWSPHIYL